MLKKVVGFYLLFKFGSFFGCIGVCECYRLRFVMQPKFAQFLYSLGYKAGQNHLFFAAQSRSRALALNSTPASPRKVPEPIGSPAGVYHS